MCHPTCGSCDAGKDMFNECKTCFDTRYFFANSCMCNKGEDQLSQYKCGDFDDKVNNLQDFIYALQWGFLVLMLLSLFVKRNIPLTRKLIDVSQTLGLLFYLHKYYEPRPSIVFQLFQMANLSSLIPNYIANYFYGEKMNPLYSSTYTYLNMIDEDQIPPYKFLINGKSSNFLVNQLQVFVIWIVGLIIFFFVGGAISIIKQGKGFCEYIRFNIMNYIYIIFYFTFQESFLNVFLQLKHLKWTQGIHYASLITMLIYLILAFVVIRSILISQNKYPENILEKKIEMFRRRDSHHFLFAFEDPLTDLSLKEKSEKTQLSPSEIIISNWIVLSLIQKAIMTAVIVFQYNEKVEISLIVIIIIFFKLFFLVRPIKNKLILVFCFIGDAYLVAVIILTENDILAYLLWPGILCLNIFMIVEDVFSNSCYPQVSEFNYLQKIMDDHQNQQKQQLTYNEKNSKDIILQNIPANSIQTKLTPLNSQKPNDLPFTNHNNNNNISEINNNNNTSNQIPLNNTNQFDQSVLKNQDSSMMQQNLIQNNEPEKLETIEDDSALYQKNNNNNNNNNIGNSIQNQNNLAGVDNSLQILQNNKNNNNINNNQKNPVTVQTKQGMIEMKSKYFEKMKQKQQQQQNSQSSLQQQPQQIQIQNQSQNQFNKQNSIPISKQQSFSQNQNNKNNNLYDPQYPYGQQNEQDTYGLNKQNSQPLKKEQSIRNQNELSQNNNKDRSNSIQQEQFDSQNNPQNRQQNQMNDKNKFDRDRDSFYFSEEEDGYEDDNQSQQKQAFQSKQLSNKLAGQSYNQQQQSSYNYNNNNKPNLPKPAKQQKIEDELSQHWQFE